MTATNPHSPANIVPAEYDFAFGYAHPSVVDGWPVPGFNMDLVRKLREEGKLYSQRGTCHSCGARFIEGAAFLHRPSGQYILVGHVCADKMELTYDISELALIQGKRHEARKIVAEKALRFAELRSLVSQLRETEEGREVLRALKHKHRITEDIRHRLIQWRSISGKQQALVVRDVQARNDKGLHALRGVSLHVCCGEIVGLAGVAGNGQRELAQVITGLRAPTAGSVEIYGQAIRAGQPVLLLYTSASRDEAEFPEADTWQLDRRAPRTLGFGHGTHACLGRHAARLEARIALEEILGAFPDYAVDLAGAERLYTEYVQGFASLPILLPGD